MAYRGFKDFSHAQADKLGVLLVNLGTPDAPTPKALRVYLSEFLSDPRVVEIPRLLWLIILHGIILRVRPKKSAAAYAEIWTDEGSPLMQHSLAQRDALQARIQERYGDSVQVELAMRYGNPRISDVADSMLQSGCRKLIVLPLYPQYSGSTTGSVFDALATDFTQRRWIPHLRYIGSYYQHPQYIEALAQSVRQHWAQHGRADKLVLSYHGVPKHFLMAGDPYHCQCHVTSRLLAEKLELASEDVMTCFQSRFGKAEWLQPYLDQTMKSLPEQGVKSVQVLCPGFSADCLETLEEIAGENKEYFMESGGERFEYIAALNSRPEHIDALLSLIEQEAGTWLDASELKGMGQENEARQQRYLQHSYNKEN